jgi:hypothetical protein
MLRKAVFPCVEYLFPYTIFSRQDNMLTVQQSDGCGVTVRRAYNGQQFGWLWAACDFSPLHVQKRIALDVDLCGASHT